MIDPALTIQILVSPVIMISACGLLLLGMQNRYGRINDRLRELTRERMDLLAAEGDIALRHLQAIDRQLPVLLQRNGLLRNAVLSVFCSVTCFVAVVFLIAYNVMRPGAAGSIMALGAFLVGQLLVMIGMIYMVREIYVSHHAVTLETLEILKLKA